MNPPALTLRQHFASLVLQGLVAGFPRYATEPENGAQKAVALADALIAALALQPRVIVTLSDGGIPTVYSSDKALNVEVVDACTVDEEDHNAAEARQAEIDAEVKAGTLFEVA